MPSSIGKPPGSAATAPKSITPMRPSGSSMKLPGWASPCSIPQPARRVEGELEQPGADQVALLGGAVPDDLGHRRALHPLLDHHFGRTGHDARHREVRVVLIRLGEGALVLGLQPVVQLHLGALDQLVDHALDVGARRELLEHPDQTLHGLEVGPQRLVGARVLDLDRHLTAVGPHTLVHLADAGRGHRGVVERAEPFAPLGAQLGVEHPVHLGGGQRRGVLLQLGQRFAVRLAELLGDRGLEHRQGLAHLHRAALELTEDREQLVGGLFQELGLDLVPGLSGQPFTEPDRCPTGESDRNAGQLCVARSPAPFDVCHVPIIHDGQRDVERRRQRTLSY